jgi:hypothetical protein
MLVDLILLTLSNDKFTYVGYAEFMQKTTWLPVCCAFGKWGVLEEKKLRKQKLCFVPLSLSPLHTHTHMSSCTHIKHIL